MMLLTEFLSMQDFCESKGAPPSPSKMCHDYAHVHTCGRIPTKCTTTLLMVSVQYYLLFKGDRHIFDSCKKRAVNVKLVTFSHQNIAVVLHHDTSVEKVRGDKALVKFV